MLPTKMMQKNPNSIPASWLFYASVFSVLLTLLFFVDFPSAHAIDPYDSGFNHGFSDAQHGDSHPYLVRSGGSRAHTDVFMQGYNDGFRNGTQKRQSLTSQQPVPSPTSSQPKLQQQPIPTDSKGNDSIIFLLLLALVVGAFIIWKLKRRGRRYKERHAFSNSTKQHTLEKQHHKCASCNRLLNVVQYHHKDGNRSNNKESNCQALCPNCHALKTHSKKNI